MRKFTLLLFAVFSFVSMTAQVDAIPESYTIIGLKEVPETPLNLETDNLTTGYYLIKNTNTRRECNKFLYRDVNAVRLAETVQTNNANFVWHINVNDDGTFQISTADNEKYWPLPATGDITLGNTANNFKYTTDNDSYNHTGTNNIDGTGSCLIYSDAVSVDGHSISYFHINPPLASWYDTNPNSLLYAQLIPIEPNILDCSIPVTDVNQFKNTSVYTITPANTASTGVICAKEGDLTKLYTTHRSGATVNPYNVYQQFAIFRYYGKNFLYNVGAQKFVKKSGEGTALTDDITAENEFVLEVSDVTPYPGHNYVQADYPWCIVFENMPLCTTAADNFSSYGGVVTNWDYNSDSGTVLSIAEVDTDVASLAEAYAKVQEFVTPATTITYNYMFNGTQIASENIETNVGFDYPAPTNVPDGYSATTPAGTVEANAVIEINLVFIGYPITDLTRLSNTSVYTITPANTAATGVICAKEDDLTKLYTTHRSGAVVNALDPYQQFAIFEYESHYFLYNVGAQKFVKKSGAGTALTDDITAENEFVFEASDVTPYPGHNYVQADYPWCIVFEDIPLCTTAADNFSSYGGVVTNWDYNSDSGTVLSIAEVDTDVASLAEAYAKVYDFYNSATTVTYKYMINGVEAASEEIETAVGFDYPVPSNVPLGYSAATPEGKVTADAVIEIELQFIGYPFEFSETADGIEHWYYIQMHSNNKKYIRYVVGENKLEWKDGTLTPEEEDLYTWAFVGTPEQGFKLVNFALGTEYALNSNGSGNPTMGAFDTAVNWIPSNSTQTSNAGYFCLKFPNGNYMNAQDGSVAFWSKADAGSTLLLTERVIEERNISLTVTAEGDGSVAIKGRIGTEAKFANGKNVTVMATVNRGYIFREWQKDGEVVSTDADYSFVIGENMSLKAVFVPKLAVTAVLDFTEDLWNLPREKEIYDAEGYPIEMNAGNFTNGEYTVKLDPTAAVEPRGLYCYTSSGSLCLYNTNTKIVLPEFDFDVAKIEIIGGSQGVNYPNADMNVYVGDNAVSTACTGLGGTNVFEIAETAQAAGNIYELKIGSNGGEYSSVVYINKIKVYPKDGLMAPEFDVEAGVYTQEFTVNISSPTATKENVTNVSYYYIKSGTDSGVEFQQTDCEVTIDRTCTLIAVVMLDYYGVEYYSETSEIEYIISDYLVAQKLTAPEAGKVFIVADGNTAVKYDADKKDSLNAAPIDAEEGTSIKTAEYYSYTLEETTDGYFLKDISDSYLAVSVGTSPSFVTAKSIPGTSTAMYTWTVTIDGDGNATISNNGCTLVYENNKFVLRSGGAGTAMLPMLYGKVSGNIDVRLNSVEGSKLINGFEKSGMATFSAPYSTILPEGVTAYYALSDGIKAEYISLVQYSGTELPAGEGFILVGEPGVTTMTVSRNAVEGLGDGVNKLGNTANAPKVLTAGECYLLASGNEGPGFYVCGSGTLAQYKAYLNISSVATGAARSVVIRFPGTTGIEDVIGENGNVEGVYDLTGRKIEDITTQGIYIINGKKVLVK